MADAAWKRREREAAGLFGASRNRERVGSDGTHPRLWLEVKALARTAIRSLWERTRTAAQKRPRGYQGGHRVPVLVTYDRGRPGGLITVHEDDFAEVAIEWLAAREEVELLEIEAAVRLRRQGAGS